MYNNFIKNMIINIINKDMPVKYFHNFSSQPTPQPTTQPTHNPHYNQPTILHTILHTISKLKSQQRLDSKIVLQTLIHMLVRGHNSTQRMTTTKLSQNSYKITPTFCCENCACVVGQNGRMLGFNVGFYYKFKCCVYCVLRFKILHIFL